MDWFVDGAVPHSGSTVRQELVTYLRRHAAAGSDIGGAELAAGELIGNAVRHAPGPAWVHVDWSADAPVLEVHDLGPGFELNAEAPDDPLGSGGRGLMITQALTLELQAAAKRAGEESFLRALVVQLAETVEQREGPAAAEAAIAQVGMDVGGQMEAQYRRARGIVDALTPQQIADLYVRLKAAIDGDFYVIEANAERIVLGNRACPFGDVVRRAPGLCRMTSSVFGGIAARNAGGATVMLEERIAVGDPECRVVVWLSGSRRGQFQAAHEYDAPGA